MFKLLSRSMTLCFAVLSPALLAATPKPTTFNRPLAFEPNRGQAPGQVSWTARGEGYELFLTSSGATITMAEPVAPLPADPQPLPGRPALLKGRVSAIRMNLAGSHSWSAVQGLEPTGAVSNYLVGDDRSKWRSGIPQYRRLRINGVYDGIDLVFYGHGRDLEYDFVLAPGADPKQIRLVFDGARPLRVDRETGDLVIKTSSGSEMRHVRPRVYQQIGDEKKEIAGSYQILDNGEAAFRLASYDRQHALVVDPSVQFTTFLQGNSQDVIVGVAVDAQGNSYVTGQTLSTNFPNFFGLPPTKVCPQNVCPAWIFVTELSPTGQVMNSTLIGGSETDWVNGIAVDATGVWVTGGTTSRNFSTHPQFAYGYWNGFVDKLSVDLSVQDWCVTFGGFGDASVYQLAYGIALDTNHNAYVTGFTMSVDFPTTLYWSTNVQPKQKSLKGNMDAFVVKVGADGYLTDGYSTYLGGSGGDIGSGIAVDSAGHAFVTGLTSSTDFPTNGATSYGSPERQGEIAFVTELSPDGSSSLYSVVLGGTKTYDTDWPSDQGVSIAVDPAGEAYITGIACSSDFPTTAGAYQATPLSACLPYDTDYQSAFAAKLSNTGQLLHATYLGGVEGSVNGWSIAISRLGDVYIGGSTTTGMFPGTAAITVNPIAGFLSEFDSTLQTLKFSKFLGATVYGVATFHPVYNGPHLGPEDPDSVYTAGYRYRPGTDTTNVDNQDAFVVKLSDTP